MDKSLTRWTPAGRRTAATGIGLILLVYAEINAQLYWVHHNSAAAVSAIYLVAGLLIGLFTLRPPVAAPFAAPPRPLLWLPAALLAIAAVLFCTSRVGDITARSPIDFHEADMFPVIRVMNERFLRGEPVYAVIPEIWSGIQPVYLPGMWMPYGVATVFGFDPRWVAIGVFLAGLVAVLLACGKKRWYPWVCLLFLLIAWLPWLDGAVRLGNSLFTVSEEGVVIGFLALLCTAIYRKWWFLSGILLALCLLSRMNLIPWALLFGGVLLLRDRRAAGITGLTCVALSAVLLVVSGAVHHPDIFLKLPDAYLANAIAGPEKFRPTVVENVGLSKFFFPDRLRILHSSMKWVAFAVPLLCLLVIRPWRRSTDIRFFVLGSLKLSLVAFYNLLLIPYEYLLHASLMVSVAIVAFWLREASLTQAGRSAAALLRSGHRAAHGPLP